MLAGLSLIGAPSLASAADAKSDAIGQHGSELAWELGLAIGWASAER